MKSRPQADVESVRRAKILPVYGRKLLIPRLKRARSRNPKRIFDSSRGSIVAIIRQSEETAWNKEILLRTLGRHLHRSMAAIFAHFVPVSWFLRSKREKIGVQLKSSTLFIARNYCYWRGNIDN